MATSTVKALPIPTRTHPLQMQWQSMVNFVVYAGLPLGLFGLVNLVVDATGHYPFFFSPLGIPGWVGAILHMAMLPLVGIAGWMVANKAGGRTAQRWLAVFAAALIAFPFVVTVTSSLVLSMLAMATLFVGVGAAVRVARISHRAAWLLAPVLAWVGLSAVLGLVFTAAWAPPFGLVQSNQPAASA